MEINFLQFLGYCNLINVEVACLFDASNVI